LKIAKRVIAFVMILAICFSFCACRTRTTKTGENNSSLVSSDSQSNTTQNNDVDDVVNDSGTPTPTPSVAKNISNTATKVKTFKADKTAVQTKSTAKTGNEKIEDSSNSNDSDAANGKKPTDNNSGNISTDNPDDSSNRNDLTDKDDEEDETPMHTAIKKYEQFLSSNNSEIYECQKLNVYFELVEQYKSVTRDNEENKLITNAGGYNVAEIKYSQIDSSWVVGKSPDMIVKVVAPTVLGKGATSTAYAQSIKEEIMSRTEWQNIPAVQNGNVLLLSEDLFKTDAGKIAAELYMAKAMYPAIYDELDIESAYFEMSGENFDGIYAYQI
jgi:hypothetical protein